jgi:general secretion pathway protein D
VIHESTDCSRLVDEERLHLIESLASERQMHAGLRHGCSAMAALQRNGRFGQEEAESNTMTRGYPLFGSFRLQISHFILLAPVLVAIIAPGMLATAHAQSASTWNKRGQTAELKQDYDTAYEDYLKAHNKSPKDLRYQTRVDRMRFQASAQHVDRGRVLRQNGDLAGALNEFSRALEIDPGNEAAAQEIAITKNLDRKSSASPGPATGGMTSMQRDLASIAGPIELKPVSDEPITLHMVEDTKNIYTAIGKLAGLNVLFDPDYTSRRIPIDLSNVSLGDALRIVGTISGTFYKALTPDTIYIAQNNHQKHVDLDDQAVQTFYLTNPSQQNDANEIYTALRQLLPPEVKSFFVPSQNAIVVRGTTDDLTLASKLLNDLDRARPEVVVDVAILEVNRDKVRNLGITLPQSVTVTPQSGTTSSTSNSSNSSSTSTTTTTNSDFTLNTLANLNAKNFAVSITGATVNALLTDSDTRVLQNPSIRATDGKQATLKIGSRIPIATGSYSAGAATGITAGIGVQTQFSYVDVGVNIDMTPTIHLNRDVSLNLTVEVSNQSGSVTISGVTEPIIGQRQTKTSIELKDGEPCLLAGIITKQDNATLTGTPGLAQIPLLKYFFGSNFKENSQDEVVFILIPHVVREAVLTRQNTRLIDTGTSTDVQLRRLSSPIDDLFPESAAAGATPANPTSAATAAVAMAQQLNQQTTHANPTAAGPATPTTPAAAIPASGPATPATTTGPVGKPAASNGAPTPVSLVVVPPNSNQTVGSTFVTSIVLTNAHDLASVPVQVQFDPKVLQLVNVEAGGLLGGDGQPVAMVHRDDGNGLLTISASRPPGASGVNGEGQVCLMTFKAIASGDSKLALVKVGARTTTNSNVPAVGTQATVHVK